MLRRLILATALSTLTLVSAGAPPDDRLDARASTESVGETARAHQMLGNGPCRLCACRGFEPMGNGAYCYCRHRYNAHWNIHIPYEK